MGIMEKLQRVDRRVIYLILVLALAIPLINPIGIPLQTSDTTDMFFKEIDALAPGSVVLVAFDYSAGGSADLHPGAVAVVKHILQKQCKVVGVAFWDAGPMFANMIFDPLVKQGKAVYGENIANLGYYAGGTSAIKNFANDVLGVAKTDFNGTPTASLPIMQGIKDAKDFALVVEYAAGDPGVDAWVQQVQEPMQIKFLVGCVTVSVPNVMPRVNTGQIKGLLQGLRGAAEYEIVSKNPGTAASGMDAQSLGHLVIIAFILVGNISYFASGGSKKKKK